MAACSQRGRKGPGSLPGQPASCKHLQAAQVLLLSPPPPAHARPPVRRPLHNSLRVDCLPPSGAHLGNRISRPASPMTAARLDAEVGHMLGPRMGHRQGLDKQTRDRFAPTPKNARLASFCLGAKPSRDPHGAPRPSRLGCQETADDHGQAEQWIGPASFCCCKLALLCC